MRNVQSAVGAVGVHLKLAVHAVVQKFAIHARKGSFPTLFGGGVDALCGDARPMSASFSVANCQEIAIARLHLAPLVSALHG